MEFAFTTQKYNAFNLLHITLRVIICWLQAADLAEDWIQG